MAFDDYVAKNGIRVFRTGRKCGVCALDPKLKAEVHELRQRVPPVPYPRITDYLRDDHGQATISLASVQKHFGNGHSA